MEEQTFTIKQVAEQTGISEDTIRYYEKIMLLPQAERKENRHRFYRKEDIYRIKQITCLKKRECRSRLCGHFGGLSRLRFRQLS